MRWSDCHQIDLKLKLIWNWIRIVVYMTFSIQILGIRSNRRNDINKILSDLYWKIQNYIKNRSNLIKNLEFNQKSNRFQPFSIKFNLFLIKIDHFWLNNWHLHNFFDLLIDNDQKQIRIDRFESNLDRNWIKIAIVDT